MVSATGPIAVTALTRIYAVFQSDAAGGLYIVKPLPLFVATGEPVISCPWPGQAHPSARTATKPLLRQGHRGPVSALTAVGPGVRVFFGSLGKAPVQRRKPEEESFGPTYIGLWGVTCAT